MAGVGDAAPASGLLELGVVRRRFLGFLSAPPCPVPAETHHTPQRGRGRELRGGFDGVGETARLRQELALLREELRIKDARIERLPPQRRPHDDDQKSTGVLAVCWPLALLALLLWPLVWLVSFPFRLPGIAVDGVFALFRAVLMLPARIWGGGRA